MKYTIRFKLHDKKHEWHLSTNIHSFGLSIQSAFENWAARSNDKTFSIENFCEYVKSKDIQFKCSPWFK